MELQSREVEWKAKHASLETDLAIKWAAYESVERKNTICLERLESVSSDATLHSHAKFMVEFKEERHAEWDPNHEIKMWHEKVEELVKKAE